MEKIKLRNKEIKCRKESRGYTIFDGYNAILANDTFIIILKLISSNKSVNEIQDILLSKFNLDNSDEKVVLHDIHHVKDFIKSKNW